MEGVATVLVNSFCTQLAMVLFVKYLGMISGGGCRSRVAVKFQNKYSTPRDAEKDLGAFYDETLSEAFHTMDIEDESVRARALLVLVNLLVRVNAC